MKLEDQGKCPTCNYTTCNKRSLCNHLRFGCTTGKNWHKEDYKKRPDYYKEKATTRYQKKTKEINEKRKLRYKLNPEKERKKVSEYVQTEKGKSVRKAVWHKYRCKKIKGNVTTEEIQDLLKRQSKCLKCNSNDNLEIDHIIPLSRGGNHEINNLQILCRKCNRSKGSKIWN